MWPKFQMSVFLFQNLFIKTGLCLVNFTTMTYI